MKKLSLPARLSIVLIIICLATLWFYPMWRIDMRAPQYPDGLVMKIWINDIKGDINIINGLNHYIGMHNINKGDFMEFIYLPISIMIFMGMAVVVFFLNRQVSYYILTLIFMLLAIFSFCDFYKWEYHYGHTLNPNAPIKVPGMAYSPPLIGYKKMLNFEVLSQPDLAGWCYISAGVLLVGFTFYEFKRRKNKTA
jgi:copper chaperone NosL